MVGRGGVRHPCGLPSFQAERKEIIKAILRAKRKNVDMDKSDWRLVIILVGLY